MGFLSIVGGVVADKFFKDLSLPLTVVFIIWFFLLFDIIYRTILHARRIKFWRLLSIIVEVLAFLLILGVLFAKISHQKGYVIAMNPIPGIVEGNSDGFKKKLDPTPSPADQTQSNCSSLDILFCSDFSNIGEKFDMLDDFTKDPGNPKILRTNLPIKGDQDNSILWVKDPLFSPEINFTLITKLRHDSKGNLTISFGKDWRCIIGDSNLNRVLCESEYDKLKHPRSNIYLSSMNKPPIPTNTQLTIRGSVSLGSDNNLNIKLVLGYFDLSESKVDAELDFKLKYASSDAMDVKKKFGVGIIDPSEEGIRVEFQKLEIR